MTEPLTPPDCDLRTFPFMPLDIVRFFGSRFHAIASDAEWRAGLTLWLKSFHQVPAASLPDDDVELARLAELGRDVKAWQRVREVALHGWVKCSDGRLYHPVVAEKAREAWEKKISFRKRSKNAAEARWHGPAAGKSADPAQKPEKPADQPIPEGYDKECLEHATSNASSNAWRCQQRGNITERDKPLETSSSGARATRLPTDFAVPAAWLEWALLNRPAWSRTDALTEASAFCDHWRAKPGAAGRKLDWQATWRNWVRNSRRAGTGPPLIAAEAWTSAPC